MACEHPRSHVRFLVSGILECLDFHCNLHRLYDWNGSRPANLIYFAVRLLPTSLIAWRILCTLLSIASFVQCTLVVRPSTANIPAVAKWAVDTVEVILADVTWDEDETWSRFWGDFSTLVYFYGFCYWRYSIRVWYSDRWYCLSFQFGFTWNIILFDELKALIWIFSRIGIHRKGEIDHVPLNDAFSGWLMDREEALFYRSAILILAVNLYIVTVQRRQFLVSRPCWSPSHHRMQPISYRRIFCLGQC